MVIKDEEKKLNEELAQMYEASIVEVKEGEILKGKIVQIGEKDVLVDIGYKSEGSIQKSEISDSEKLEMGDEIDVMLESKENDYGMIVLSHEKARRLKSWQNIVENYKEGDVIEGKVTKKVRGGFMVDVGMQAFLPASLSMMQEFSGGDNMVGESLTFKIVKINIPRKNIVLSRKELVEEKRKEEKQELLKSLNKDDIVRGIVRNITDFGAFVDIGGGITGLLHITDMSWGRVSHPSEVVNINDEIDVKVLDFDKETVKVSLGLKQVTANPWEDVADKYPEGTVIEGKVVNIMPYGIFVELDKGVEGLIHISEFSWSKKFNHPSEKFSLGDKVEAIVLKADKENQKLSLGIKQLEKNPWEGVGERYSVGDKIKGQINAVTDYGAFVELEKGVEGLVHVSDLSWTKRITHPKDRLKKDDDIEAIILSVDEQNKRIALGIKQLSQDPWDEIIKKYETDTVCEGKITNITNFGIFVELEEDLEGLLHISEIDLAPGQRMENFFKVDDVVKVRVIHIDGIQKKIALSNKLEEGGTSKETAEETEDKGQGSGDKCQEEAPAEEAKEEAPAEEAKEEAKEEAPAEEAKEEAKEEAPVEEAKEEASAEEAKEEAPAEEVKEKTTEEQQ